MNIKLRKYQEILDTSLENSGDRVLLVKPTGTGKTILFMNYAINRKKRTLILTNAEELIDQAIIAAKQLNPNVSIGKFIRNERDLDSQIIVASVATLKNINNLILVDRDFDLIIYDEAHHAVAPTSKRILYAFGMCDLDTAGHDNVEFIEPHFMEGRKLIGVTATPDRTDEIELGKIFHERIDAPSLEWFIDKGYLCDLRFLNIDTGIDMSDVRSYLGDLSEKDMAKKLIETGYIAELYNVIDEHFDDCKHILLYLPDVNSTKLCTKLLKGKNISSDYVVGSDNSDRRREVIRRFKDGEIRVLVNCLVLKEGFDAPNTDAIILCRPTKSKLLLKQIIGRGTRNSDNKSICKIGDLVFKRRQNDIISASGIFDIDILSDVHEETMTIKEKIRFQKERKPVLASLVSVLDKIKEEKEKELAFAKKKKRREKHIELDIERRAPESIMLLLDTRMLRNIGLDVNTFYNEFHKEHSKLIQSNQLSSWKNKESPHGYQIDFLQYQTSYDEKDLSILKPVEAQSLINIIKRYTKPTSISLKMLLHKVHGVPIHKIPRSHIQANKMIKQISMKRMSIQHGKA